ncbi:thiamine-phosphate pyrophosphorylase [Variibacter gotjawalensis]|uniref:Thiamine-phosphate pyrophosphorylase n=1 Tax=Variibacter gotjawalensis TaxID=1333996 RepID=A0A0S3PVY6_9BRAD|nr:thiamine phosphate synthase [Variibacter gotjawalensis]NIK45869.1 thiamine-phosphate pyrophosphorylase [Variibacter gotjawalensis]RZS47792.1 thiamine-phosphate pyrophosphorylase [Variibacter gotjawalensis]BAT60046.1 thiamine-phosphate pyrophosphorylase [Variibacter gotjawalensis]
MASRNADVRPAPRLYLVTPTVEDAAAFTRPLEAALKAGDVAAVLLRVSGADERADTNIVKALAGIVQAAGVALLVDGKPLVAQRGGADGAHLPSYDEFAAAQQSLQPARIAGVGGLASRDEAMRAAEDGADYVMFGEPDLNGEVPALDASCERVAWWSEVFEVPCVAYAPNAEAVAPLAAAGPEFIALGPFIWDHADGPAAAIRDAATVIAAATPAMESV